MRLSLSSLAIALLLVLAPVDVHAQPVAEPHAAETAPAWLLACEGAGERVSSLVAAGYSLDAHLTALAVDALCSGRAQPSWRLWDAVSLVHMEEFDRAHALLRGLRGEPALANTARTLAAWALLEAGDDGAFGRALPSLSPDARMRLETLAAVRRDRDVNRLSAHLNADLRRAVSAEYRGFRAARSKRPWLAGSLSALLPGLGQAYAGSWQGAAVALVLNGVLLAGTVELARHDLYFASATTGLAASVFYVGNILNATDLARRHNQRAAAPAAARLERLLVPEAIP